jgi:hypothetical protein
MVSATASGVKHEVQLISLWSRPVSEDVESGMRPWARCWRGMNPTSD